jgi:hypothetical protein
MCAKYYDKGFEYEMGMQYMIGDTIELGTLSQVRSYNTRSKSVEVRTNISLTCHNRRYC